MQLVTYFVASSLDGCIARADGSFDAFPMEGDHVNDYLAALRSYDSVVMGRGTYEVALEHGVTNPYPWLRTFVVSRTLPDSTDPNVTILRDDPVEAVRKLKADPGRGIYLCGGGDLAATLLDSGVVDRIILKLNPLVLGGGIPVVGKPGRGSKTHDLALEDHKVYPSGVVFLHYRVKTVA